MKSARDAIEAAAKRVSTADVRNGWSIDRDVGRWGADYGKRAVAARRGLGVNAPEDAIFMVARFDANGQRFDGNNRYVVHFDKDKLPPADGFWSLSLYNDQQQFAENPAHRYNLGSSDKLQHERRWLARPRRAERRSGRQRELAAGAEGPVLPDPARVLAEGRRARRTMGAAGRAQAGVSGGRRRRDDTVIPAKAGTQRRCFFVIPANAGTQRRSFLACHWSPLARG